MKRILLTLVCFLVFSVSAFATEERMQTLPQDQGAWYLTTFGDPADAKFQQIQSWLASDAGLAKLKTQVRFNQYETDQVRYQRYAKDMPGLPCIRLQNAMGIVVSEFWGDNIPQTSADLFAGIQGDLKDTTQGCLRRRRCKPQPQPEPPPPPVVVPEPPVGPPDIVPEPEPEKESNLWLALVALAAIIGGSIGFVQEFKAVHLDKDGADVPPMS